MYCIMATPKFLSFYTVKRALQNTQNDCHQWLSHSFGVHKFVFLPGVSLRGAYSAPPDPLNGLRGTLLLTGREGRTAPQTQIPGSASVCRGEVMGRGCKGTADGMSSGRESLRMDGFLRQSRSVTFLGAKNRTK